MGRKKKEYFARVFIEGKKFHVPLDVKRSNYNTWDIGKGKIVIASINGGIKCRDEGIWRISILMNDMLNPVNLVKNKENIKKTISWRGEEEWDSKIPTPNWPTVNNSYIRSASWHKSNAIGILKEWFEENEVEIEKNVKTFLVSKKFGI
jgi:hypothetical protein